VGPLIVPTGASIYIDANVLIYSVERVQPYVQTLDPFWQDVSAQQAQVLTSQLTALEALVGPLKAGDTALEKLFRQALFSSPDLRLVPVSLPVLERAAHLRATLPSLKTPDAIHAATALIEGCVLLLTNDPGFRQVPDLNATVLSDLLTP
jgi:predicted nucleic acid-binding protein